MFAFLYSYCLLEVSSTIELRYSIGDTTKDFLTRLRLEKAALNLKHSQNDIGQIAFDCGYQNHETFTRAFKDYFGLSPIEYRNSIVELTCVGGRAP